MLLKSRSIDRNIKIQCFCQKTGISDRDCIDCKECGIQCHKNCYNFSSNAANFKCLICSIEECCPFAEINSLILGPQIITSNKYTKRFTFSISKEIKDLLDQKSEYLTIFCTKLEADKFIYECPLNIELMLNNEKIQLEMYGEVTLTDGQEKAIKFPDNSIEVKFTGREQQAVFLAATTKLKSKENLFNELMTGIGINEEDHYEISKSNYFRFLNSISNKGVECGSLRLFIADPLLPSSYIKKPGRGKHCDHFQCFDLENFLEYNKNYKKDKRWTCPICQRRTLPRELIYDSFCENAINQARKDNIPLEASIEMNHDKGLIIIPPNKEKNKNPSSKYDQSEQFNIQKQNDQKKEFSLINIHSQIIKEYMMEGMHIVCNKLKEGNYFRDLDVKQFIDFLKIKYLDEFLSYYEDNIKDENWNSFEKLNFEEIQEKLMGAKEISFLLYNSLAWIKNEEDMCEFVYHLMLEHIPGKFDMLIGVICLMVYSLIIFNKTVLVPIRIEKKSNKQVFGVLLGMLFKKSFGVSEYTDLHNYLSMLMPDLHFPVKIDLIDSEKIYDDLSDFIISMTASLSLEKFLSHLQEIYPSPEREIDSSKKILATHFAYFFIRMILKKEKNDESITYIIKLIEIWEGNKKYFSNFLYHEFIKKNIALNEFKLRDCI